MNPSTLPEQPRLRIAVLNRHFSAKGGGAERYSMALVENLAARHEMHVFAQHVDHQWPDVTYHRVAQPFARPRWLNQLWYATATWWATRRGFDVVHSHENTWHGQIQTVHVLPVKYNLFHGRQGLAWLLRWVKVMTSPRLLAYLALERSRFSVKSGRTIVVTSATLVPQVLEAYPACKDAIEVLTPGVERVYGVATEQEKSASRLALGLSKDGFCILFVGNDFGKKGLATLIKALSQLPTHCYVAVVGNLAQKPQFAAQAMACGVTERVVFLGQLADVGSAYQAADCLAHPTHEDTFAMVVLEAMSHGLPVVVSGEKYCGIAGLLQHGVHALVLVDPMDENELSAALLHLCHESVTFARFELAALNFASEHLWGTIARQQGLCYQRIAAITDH
jgi:UDP-glucose:(heptosyl)LPS alpha-1,3-glucosyltransferase